MDEHPPTTLERGGSYIITSHTETQPWYIPVLLIVVSSSYLLMIILLVYYYVCEMYDFVDDDCFVIVR